MYVVTINGKSWVHAVEVCRALGYNEKSKTVNTIKHQCSSEDIQHKNQLVVIHAENPVH